VWRGDTGDEMFKVLARKAFIRHGLPGQSVSRDWPYGIEGVSNNSAH